MKSFISLFIGLILACSFSYAQSLSIFDIDTSSFPIMKAKFFAMDAEGKQVTGINPSDFSLTENGIPREIVSVSCPPIKPARRISSTIVIDISGSMFGKPLDIAKTMAKTWVNSLPLGQSDCALVSFNGSNYFDQDFTTNRNKLLSTIDGLIADNGTDYDEALINPVAGGILTAKTGKHKRVIVFITDGLPNNPPDEDRIIAEAQANDITIHCITIGLPAHLSMFHFAEQTGGRLFENVKTAEDATRIAQILLGESVYDYQPCDLQWKSEFVCEKLNIEIELKWNSSLAFSQFLTPLSAISEIRMKPSGVRFINKPLSVKSDTTIFLTAVNTDCIITRFICSDARFSISPSNISILKGETKEVTLSFTPSDSSSCFSSIEIINTRCGTKYFATSAYPGSKIKNSYLKLTAPNGGEELVVGTDTLISWTGVLPEDKLKLEYSYDNGATWNWITNEATGLKYNWKNVPRPESNKCLMRINSINTGHSIEWGKSFGGSGEDVSHEIVQTLNGYIIVGETKSNDGDVDINRGDNDVWIIYMNNNGEPIWKRTFGGYSYDKGYSVKEMDDGSFVIGAITNSSEIKDSKGLVDFWLIKLDINGNTLWSKRYGGQQYDYLNYIEKTRDGGILAVGGSWSSDGDLTLNHGSSDAWILKLDSDGNIEWQKSLGGSGWDFAYYIAQTNDNCFVITGFTESIDGDISKNQGDKDSWIAKLSFDGKLLWSKTLGGSSWDYITSIKETQDYGFIVIGYSNSNDGDLSNNHGYNDALVAKFDVNGNLLWSKLVGGSNDDRAYSIIETNDGNYIYVGHTNSNDGDITLPSKELGTQHLWLVKLNRSGQIIWSEIYDLHYSEWGASIHKTSDDGLIIAGYSQRSKDLQTHDFLAIKFSPELSLQSDISDSLFSIVAPKVTALNIDMGQVVLGSYKDSVITAFIKNTSKYDCQIKDIKSASKEFYVISNPTFTLKGNTEQAIEIHFKPSKLGKIYSSINIETQDTSFAQSIEGEGIQPTLQINTALIDFGKVSVGELKDTAIVLLENISGGSIDISDVKLLGPDFNQFEILEGGGAFTLTSGQTRDIKLRFKPVYIGRTSCILGFFHNGINSPAKAQLYGQGLGGLVSVTDDSAYIGEKVKIHLLLNNINPTALQNVASSFRAKLKYLTAPLSLVYSSLKIGETSDSTLIEVIGNIGSDSVLFTIDFIANYTSKNFTTLDIVDIKWFDAGGNGIEYEAETQDGSFKLLKFSGMAKVYCTSDSARPGDKLTLKLKTFGIDPIAFKEIAPKFKATLRYQKTLLATLDKSLTVNYVGDSAFVQVRGDVVDSDELASIDFVAGLGAVDSTSIEIVEIKWLNSKGEEVAYETLTEGGLFKLLGLCREGGERLFNPTGKAGISELSPNPARDEINVTVNQTEEGGALIAIYDLLGNEMDRIIINNETLGQRVINIDLTKFPHGTYYLKYQSSTTVDARRFVVE